VLLRELAVFLIRLHQVRFNFFLCVLFHFRHLSLVESPRQTGPWNRWPARQVASLHLKWRTVDRPSIQDFTMNVFS
jgi:hypothetical protein